MITLTADWPIFARVGVALLVALVAFPIAGFAANAVRKAASKSAKLEVIDKTVVSFGAELVRVGFLIAALILVLILAGVESTSVAAVLGAATLAVGLALQATLANVAAGVLIFIFRPFRVGEYVEVASKQGVVKLLSLFTTELETINGLSVVLANAQIMAQPMTNYTRNPNRRVDVDITLDWDTNTDTAIAIALAAIQNDPRLSPSQAPIGLIKSISDKGPVLSVRLWTKTSDSAELGFSASRAIHRALQEAGVRPTKAGV
jgi:small conductance mechanosensitive channel